MSQLFNMNYRTYEDLTLEFLSSFDIEKGRNGLVKHVVYRLLNRSHRMSLEGFARKFGLPCTGLTVQPSSFNSGELWFAMTGENIESFQHAPSHKIHQPVLRLWTRFTGWTIFGRIEPNNVRSDEISILGSYLRRGDEDGDFTMNIAHLFALHLKKQGTTYTTIKSNGERSNIPIVLGGLVTHLALREGFDEASRCPVPGPITLDQHYLTTAGWLSIDFNRFSWIIGRTNRFSVPLPSPALTKIMPHQPSYLLQFPSDSSTPAIMAGIRELRVGQLDLSTRVQTIETSLRELNAGQQDFRLAMYPVYDYFCRQGNIPRDGPHPSWYHFPGAGDMAAMGDSESAFIVAHKKATLTKLSNGVERISVSIDLYNHGSLSFAAVGVDPSIMGFGPAFAIPAAVKYVGLKLNDINLFEINEAFASQYVYCCKKLNLDPAKVNVNEGAIALGYPLGATADEHDLKFKNFLESEFCDLDSLLDYNALPDY
uniref:Thiolase C-terminal domain-containing protein n=1 Tax=Chenopodium quinoa TaxID=63459 RepID=A0A803N9H7_CHEQI